MTILSPTPDFSSELRRLTALSAEGSYEALLRLGWIYQHGAGVPPDQKEAERCYKAAIERDLQPDALFYLARLYVEQKRYNEAFSNFVAASEKNHLPSTYWTGWCYLNGNGVRKDVDKARSYITKAADKGHLFAQRDYYGALMRGTFGHRAILRGFFGWQRSVFLGTRLAAMDPRSELLQ